MRYINRLFTYLTALLYIRGAGIVITRVSVSVSVCDHPRVCIIAVSILIDRETSQVQSTTPSSGRAAKGLATLLSSPGCS